MNLSLCLQLRRWLVANLGPKRRVRPGDIAQDTETDQLLLPPRAISGRERVMAGPPAHPSTALYPMLILGAPLRSRRTLRVHEYRPSVVVLAIPVVTPFPDVAAHVIKPEGIRFFLGDRLRQAIDFERPPRVRLLVFAPPVTARARASPTSVFPFGFRRQPVAFAFLRCELFAEFPAVFPAHVPDRDGVTPTRPPVEFR